MQTINEYQIYTSDGYVTCSGFDVNDALTSCSSIPEDVTDLQSYSDWGDGEQFQKVIYENDQIIIAEYVPIN